VTPSDLQARRKLMKTRFSVSRPLHFALTSVALLAATGRAALPLLPEQIVVTCFSGTVDYNTGQVFPNLSPNGFVVAQFDTTTTNIGSLIPPTTSPPYSWNVNSTPPLSGFHNETGQLWNAANLGEVFGITVDDATPPNIYVTATDCYNTYGASTALPSGSGGRGGVYRLDGTTGAISSGSLPNDPVVGPGHGNVCYRRAGNGTGYLYVSNLEDGKIYRMGAATLTQVGSPFDHGVQARPNESLAAITDNGTAGLTQLGRRIWGLKTYQNRLYYAVWWEDARNASTTESNEIWSVDLDNAGDFIPSTARRRILLPDFTVHNWSYPVASIDFSTTGTMFLAERYWQVWPGWTGNGFVGAHHTRIHRYWQVGTNWMTDPSPTHHIGGDPSPYLPNTMVGANSAGGVAVNCDDSIWATGDMFAGSYSTPPNSVGGPNDLGAVYGALRIPSGGNSALAGYGYGGFAIDFDGLTNAFTQVDKFAVGAIATVRDCCIPPPTNMVAWWPLDELNGATIYADQSGNGNNAFIESGASLGTFPSPFATPGKVAGASFFIDSPTRGRAPNSASLNFGTGSFTIDCWARPVFSSPQTWQVIVDKFDTNTLRGYSFGISNGAVVLRLGDGAVSTHIGPAITYSAWNFVAVAVNRTSGNVRFFVNGVLSAPQPMSLTGTFNNTRDLLIGAASFSNNVTEIALDEIELFNRVLASNEVAAIWVADKLGKCKSPQPTGCSNSVVSITCPTNMAVSCAPVIHYPTPRAMTTCGTITNIVCNPPSGSFFPVGTTTVTCVAVDSQGSSNSCTFTITAAPDTTPPTIDCSCLQSSAQELLEVTGCQGVVPSLCRFTQCYRDECCLQNCTQNPPPGTIVGPGVTQITLTVSDCAGNTNSCVLNFIVTPPPDGCDPCTTCCQITCPTNITVTTCASSSVVNYPAPTLSSTCDPTATISCNPPSGSVFPLGTTVVTCTASTGGGTSVQCQFNVTVNRATNAWTVQCPTSSINVTGCPPRMPDLSQLIPVATNCPLLCPVTMWQSIAPGTPLTPGQHTVIVRFCDCFDTCRDCDVIINAVSTATPPTIKCPPNQIVLTCSNSAIVNYKVGASGHTGPIVCTPSTGSAFPLGTTTVTCTATNNCGQSVSCSFTVTVKPRRPAWLCNWHLGTGVPFETIGGATVALRAVGPGPGKPPVCIFPNPVAADSGIRFRPGPVDALTFTLALDATAPVGSSVELVPPPGGLPRPPLVSFKRVGTNGTYRVALSHGMPSVSPEIEVRAFAVNTNGNLLDPITFTLGEIETNGLFDLGFVPGVSNCHVTVEVNARNGTVSVEFDGPIVPSTARKGWDGCIYGPDRPVKKPKHTARVILVPVANPPMPPITRDLSLIVSGMAEVGVEDVSVTEQGRKWGDGHITLMKAYDDAEQGLEFSAFGPDGAVELDLGATASFNVRLKGYFETGDVPTENQLLTRTIGPIRGLTNRPQPPFLDALLLQGTTNAVAASVDFNNLGSPTVTVQLFSNGVMVAQNAGVSAKLDLPLFTLPAWPETLGKFGGTTPCRRGTFKPGFVRVLNAATGAEDLIGADEFRVLAEPPPGAPNPDFYSAFEIIPSDGPTWRASLLDRTLACVSTPLKIDRRSDSIGLTWSGDGFRLQGAVEVTGPWIDLGAESPVTLPTGHSARFFRLICD
jgi:hypothetical protein